MWNSYDNSLFHNTFEKKVKSEIYAKVTFIGQAKKYLKPSHLQNDFRRAVLQLFWDKFTELEFGFIKWQFLTEYLIFKEQRKWIRVTKVINNDSLLINNDSLSIIRNNTVMFC